MIHYNFIEGLIIGAILIIILSFSICSLFAYFFALFKNIRIFSHGFTYKYIKKASRYIIIFLLITAFILQLFISFIISTCKDENGDNRNNFYFSYIGD